MSSILLLNQFVSSFNNAIISKKLYFDTKYNNLTLKVIKNLSKNNIINGYYFLSSKNNIRIYLRYNNDISILQKLKNISKPSHIKNITKFNMYDYLSSGSYLIISNSEGINLVSNKLNNIKKGLILLKLQFNQNI